jgi:ATPase subunit of ABC transporter with duplicated ATPase domains
MDAAAALIENEPPVRDSVSLAQLAVSRLGKDVVDLLDVSVSYPGPDGAPVPVLRDIEWRIAPGERTGILGINGAGKSTLLGLVAGTVAPTTGRVKHGKTVRTAVLDQRLAELDEIAHLRVSAVVADQRAAYVSGGVELSPGQLLERLGFTSAQLSTPVKDLSGGQKRRLQLLLILLEEPNVLILDEPTNDLDTDMLAAMEDLLDSWPGTLLVVSHDRYLVERVTDQQYALLGGHLRHLPGGVEEYLKLSAGRVGREAAVSRPGFDTPASPAPQPAGLRGSARRDAEKELAAIDRRLAKLADAIRSSHDEFAAHEQSDYAGLAALQSALGALESEAAALEERWLELSTQLEG